MTMTAHIVPTTSGSWSATAQLKKRLQPVSDPGFLFKDGKQDRERQDQCLRPLLIPSEFQNMFPSPWKPSGASDV